MDYLYFSKGSPIGPTRTLWTIFAVALLTISGAWIFQAFGFAPCELCLLQRWPYYIAIVLSLFLTLWPLVSRAWWIQRLGLIILGGVFLVSAGLALYHFGVETHWWKGPTACSASAATATNVSILEQLKTVKIVRCDEVSLRIFGISLSGWNVLISSILSIIAFRGAS